VIGVGILLNEANYAAMITEAVRSPTIIYLSGLLSLPPGLAILNVYRRWTADWRVIITILGWLLLIGGVIRIVLPQITATLGSTLYSTSTGLTAFSVMMLVLGGYLSFEGYRLRRPE
jgi:predicted phage tail protein